MSQPGSLRSDAFRDHTVVLVVPTGAVEPWMIDKTWDIARLPASGGRRVALVDLSLRKPVLHRPLNMAPPIGVVDVFSDDLPVSDAAIKDETESLHFLAVGSPAEHPADVLGHERWPRLASGFKNEHALLIAFVPPQALPVLNLPVDAVILLEGSEHGIPSPGLTRLKEAGVPVLAELTADSALYAVPEPPPPPPPRPVVKPRPRPEGGGDGSGLDRRWLAAAVAVVIIGAAVFFTTRGGDATPVAPPLAADGPVEPTTEADSMFYALQVAAFQNLDRARERAAELDEESFTATVTPVHRGIDTWYRVLIGMYPQSVAADSALRALWQDGRVERPHGTILRTTHALDLGGHPTPEQAFSAAQGLREQGIPAYVLVAREGARVLFGAFEETGQAGVAESLLVDAGIESQLVPRLGTTR